MGNEDSLIRQGQKLFLSSMREFSVVMTGCMELEKTGNVDLSIIQEK